MSAPGPAAFLAELRGCVGALLAETGWILVDQSRIDRFAEATGDRQFVHVDPVRAAAETPFGGTVAHGYLTLSLLGAALGEAMPGDPAIRAVLNLGADKVRFLAPVPVDSRLRTRLVLNGVGSLPENRVALRLGATVEAWAEPAPKPVLTADVTAMLILAPADPEAAP